MGEDQSSRPNRRVAFGPQLVFHSLRKTVVTILENAGVPENVVADIVGHEKTTMTYVRSRRGCLNE